MPMLAEEVVSNPLQVLCVESVTIAILQLRKQPSWGVETVTEPHIYRQLCDSMAR